MAHITNSIIEKIKKYIELEPSLRNSSVEIDGCFISINNKEEIIEFNIRIYDGIFLEPMSPEIKIQFWNSKFAMLLPQASVNLAGKAMLDAEVVKNVSIIFQIKK